MAPETATGPTGSGSKKKLRYPAGLFYCTRKTFCERVVIESPLIEQAGG